MACSARRPTNRYVHIRLSTEGAGDYREDSRERFFMNSGVSTSAAGAQRHRFLRGESWK
jgi:hypothetical protein